MSKTAHTSFGFLFLLQIHLSALFAQPYQFRHLTIDDGLSQNSINCIFQDSKGLMWFGTQEGLNCYNGYDFFIFRYDPADSNSLSHNWIWDVQEDQTHNLWVATWNGLTKYNPLQNSFTRYLPDSTDDSAIRGSRPVALCKDTSGILWVGTWGGGLNRYNAANDNFTSFSSEVTGDTTLPGKYIRAMYIDKQNILWAGTWNGLWKANLNSPNNIEFDSYIHDPSNSASISGNRITAIGEDSKGHIWVGTLGAGLNLYDKNNDHFLRFRHQPQDPNSLSDNDISSIQVDRKGNLWVGTVSAGLNRYNPKRNNFTHILVDPNNPGSIHGNNVYSIFEDRSGLLWVGAEGLNILNPSAGRFRHIATNPGKKNSLSNNKVTCFYEDEMGTVWIGTENHGVNRYYPQTDSFTLYQHDEGISSGLNSNNISVVTGDGKGIIWIGSRGGGVNQIDLSTGKINVLRENNEIPATKGLDYVNGLCYDPTGYLWIATYNEGLVRYDLVLHKYTSFQHHPQKPNSLSGNYLLRLFMDSRETLWIGTWGSGLNRYNRNTNSFTRFLNDPQDPASIGGNIIHDISENITDTGRILLVGTNRGLSILMIDSISNGFHHISEKDGLPGSSVYAVLPDDNHNLWISSNNGLTRFQPVSGRIRNFTVKDGLQSNEFNAGAKIKLNNGYFIFGGVEGFNIFCPDSIHERSYQPPIVFTSFLIFNKKTKLPASLPYTRNIQLNYRQNFFSFEFASLDYAMPERNEYRYIMEGVDEGWVESGTRRYAGYTGLDPGEYVFRVQGTNSDGVWSNQEASMNIIIIPPWWKTWWFRILGILFGAGMLYLIHLYRLQQVRKIERLRVRIASDLHDDLGAVLTRITIHSQQIETSRDTVQVLTISHKIAELSRQIISTLSDIIWSIDARNDTIGDLLARMQDVAHNTLPPGDISVTFQHKGLNMKKHLKVISRQHIYYIYKEAITNIAKHSGAQQVVVKFINDENGFELSVTDDGKGFEEKESHRGNGLRNMKMRARRLGANLTVNNTGKGTEIRLRSKEL